ncbi:hypothetical protein Tco_1174109 [Tanacetum coccineum]
MPPLTTVNWRSSGDSGDGDGTVPTPRGTTQVVTRGLLIIVCRCRKYKVQTDMSVRGTRWQADVSVRDDSAIVNNPTYRSFDDYKWEFNLEIDKLANEYELGIGKKGHILDNIWEYCNQVHDKNYGWHNHEFENEEREEMGIEDEDYHPPEVQVETFEVKKYSFEGG